MDCTRTLSCRVSSGTYHVLFALPAFFATMFETTMIWKPVRQHVSMCGTKETVYRGSGQVSSSLWLRTHHTCQWSDVVFVSARISACRL